MTKLSLTLIAILATSPALACETADLAGSWRAYELFLGTGRYQHCGLKIIATGHVQPDTNCRDNYGTFSQVTGGRFTVDENCRVHGQASNWFGRFEFDSAFLSRDKNLITGVGNAEDMPTSVSIVRKGP